MTVQVALKQVLRDVVGVEARAHGFKGSAPTWRRTNGAGDWAILNVRSWDFSTSSSLQCVVNLSVAPGPWLDWTREVEGGLPKALGESFGLYRQTLHPTGTPAGADTWWRIDRPRAAAAVGDDMVRRLQEVGWPTLTRLLDRDAMLEQVRAGDLGSLKRERSEAFFARAEALLIADRGPSVELEALLRLALEDVAPRRRGEAERFAAWVRARASGAQSAAQAAEASPVRAASTAR